MSPTIIVTAAGGGLPVRAEVADTWAARLRGLLDRDRLADENGLLLTRCPSVHTLGMAFAIDILFLTADCRILRVAPGVRPWRAVFGPRGTAQVLELAAGAAGRRGWQAGTQLLLQPCP